MSAESASSAFRRRFRQTKTAAGPGNQMADRREAAHVRADFRMRTRAVVSLRPGIVNRRPTAARKGPSASPMAPADARTDIFAPVPAAAAHVRCSSQAHHATALLRGPCAAQLVAASSRPSSVLGPGDTGRNAVVRRVGHRREPSRSGHRDRRGAERGSPREGTVGFTSRGATRGAHSLGRVRHASARLLDGLPHGR